MRRDLRHADALTAAVLGLARTAERASVLPGRDARARSELDSLAAAIRSALGTAEQDAVLQLADRADALAASAASRLNRPLRPSGTGPGT